jgi:hypothetical protein
MILPMLLLSSKLKRNLIITQNLTINEENKGVIPPPFSSFFHLCLVELGEEERAKESLEERSKERLEELAKRSLEGRTKVTIYLKFKLSSFKS